MRKYRGSCLCGGVTFEITQFDSQVGHCHCSMCRKFHGAAFSTFINVPRGRIRWLTGDLLLRKYTAQNGTERTFCEECGSSLAFKSSKSERGSIEIALSALDDHVPVTPDAHIFMSSKADWYSDQDDLPKFEQGRDSSRFD
ncbi:putative Glutathione-dependent formaldehyde-activating enzyme [Vibrio nigripulchritudo SFn27]|uniref:Putative Glutathione-dependent formaldehyde-activating enzyme n=1 Tax=Vibrio nigripulchritudo TaxID=28173 RepID=U4KC99_9VIBR|nr:GFA family protein [Vibrio nigripulchritudo]CCN33753.1 putative Glutathione-dependent formaldehyde-activating enzyme [Vibrio nigripulchritudo AM115]CCN41955.1 putative Glutathione-dependent formaldehyde-activating enzyme [Vibrio nigripulchritudo FTn2]CCN66253.1 putative Glutathione-dependent formaldehyde-activating enzyme [Vibrio nigripulchritudo POn4]CCN74611.1 putative Glutathione-dependent formaldehyde-activating enzyme [Vibrio nigripulchritudo SO65]CCN81287.1 putative Glutathione-depend